MGQIYAALAGYVISITTIITYAALTWTELNRSWISLTLLAALAFASSCYGLRERMVTSKHRIALFTGWNLASLLLLVLVCALDGGIASPLSNLLILPILYLIIGYPLRAVLVSGATGLTAIALLILFSPGPVVYPTLTMQLMALTIGFVLAIIGAVIRTRRDQEWQQLQQRLEILAATDDLTGCQNQRAFTAALSREIARAARYGQMLALLVIDVDNFKSINDRYGHMMGDEVLCRVGKVLRQAARHADIVGRPGGDEFALLAPETDYAMAGVLAERLQTQIRAQSLSVDVTLSIGICAMVPGAGQAVTMRRQADQALYRAKRQGRAQAAVFDTAEIISYGRIQVS